VRLALRQADQNRYIFTRLDIAFAISKLSKFNANPTTDSQTALEISDNPAKYRQAKHIDVRYQDGLRDFWESLYLH
jgi:hypothetical protein